MDQTQKEALAKVSQAAQDASKTLRSVMGQRHYLMGVKVERAVDGKKEDIYWLMVRAEAALIVLAEACQRATHSQSTSESLRGENDETTIGGKS